MIHPSATRLKWLAAIGLAIAVIVAAGLWVNHGRVGRVLDTYRGVPTYDNGLLFFRSYGKHYGPDGYYYGQKWQCVEYAKRFYHQAKGHKMPDVWGHARDYFDPALPDGVPSRRRGLMQYHNGSSAKPLPEDLLVFTDTKFGHVAIVTEVADGWLEVVQQNILGKSRQRFTLVSSNGCWVVTAPRKPAGWLRLPTAPIIWGSPRAHPSAELSNALGDPEVSCAADTRQLHEIPHRLISGQPPAGRNAFASRQSP